MHSVSYFHWFGIDTSMPLLNNVECSTYIWWSSSVIMKLHLLPVHVLIWWRCLCRVLWVEHKWTFIIKLPWGHTCSRVIRLVMSIYSVSENACLVPYQYVCVLLALKVCMLPKNRDVADRVLSFYLPISVTWSQLPRGLRVYIMVLFNRSQQQQCRDDA